MICNHAKNFFCLKKTQCFRKILKNMSLLRKALHMKGEISRCQCHLNEKERKEFCVWWMVSLL